MKKYEYSVIRPIGNGSDFSSGGVISWRCSTREDARIQKRDLKQAGINAKIVQTIYKQVEQKEIR